jgi:hypothetical protein
LPTRSPLYAWAFISGFDTPTFAPLVVRHPWETHRNDVEA